MKYFTTGIKKTSSSVLQWKTSLRCLIVFMGIIHYSFAYHEQYRCASLMSVCVADTLPPEGHYRKIESQHHGPPFRRWKDRDKWQKPDKVLDLFEPIEGKVIADIGAGTGYFSIKLARRGAKVLAIDIDSTTLATLRHIRDSLGFDDTDIDIRKVPPDDPALPPSSVDMVWIVNTYHHIENRSAYFSKLIEALRPGGILVNIDFKKESLPFGPPTSIKLTPEEVITELRQAGFKNFRVDSTLLPYQYIIIASK